MAATAKWFGGSVVRAALRFSQHKNPFYRVEQLTSVTQNVTKCNRIDHFSWRAKKQSEPPARPQRSPSGPREEGVEMEWDLPFLSAQSASELCDRLASSACIKIS